MSARDCRSVVKELSISWDFKAHLNKDFLPDALSNPICWFVRPEVSNGALRNPISPFRYWCLSGKKKQPELQRGMPHRHPTRKGILSQITFSFDNGLLQCIAVVSSFITPSLKSLVVPVIWLALIGAIYSRIAPFFALNRIFFLANEEVTLKTKQLIRF